jgi:hypothetical protein
MPVSTEKASIALALCDFIPNLLYLAGSLTFATLMAGKDRASAARMFACGAVLVFAAGVLKAISKLGDAVSSRPVTEGGFLYDQMIPVMAIGFLATATAVIGLLRRPAPTPSDAIVRIDAIVPIAVHFVAVVLLVTALVLSARANLPGQGLRPTFLKYKKISLIAMIVFQLVTVGVLAALAFRAHNALTGTLCVLSIAAMLAMGALGSPSVQARFQNRIAMNWLDEGVNILAQAAYLAAAFWLALFGGRAL